MEESALGALAPERIKINGVEKLISHLGTRKKNMLFILIILYNVCLLDLN